MRGLFALLVASPAAAVCEMGVLSPNGECICERGFFINIASNCEPCPIATYEKDRECVECPETKVTRKVAAKSDRDCVCDENVEYDAAADRCIIRDKSVDLNAKFAFTWRHVTGQTLFSLMYYAIIILLGFILSKLSHAKRAPLMKLLVKIEYHMTHNMMYLSVAFFLSFFQAIHFILRSITRETSGAGNAAEFVSAVITIAESVVLCFHAFQTSLHMAMQAMIFMLRDSLIVVSSLMMPVQLVDDYPTWFSYGFLGALRAYSVCTRMLNASISGSLSVKWQVISVLIQTFAVIYVAAAIMFVLETLGEPTEGLEEFNSDTWTILSSFYFIFVTISTVGYGDLSPATGLGRAVVLLAIILGISQFGSGIGQVAEAVRLNRSGHGNFTPPPRAECIVVCGNPSAQMLMVFLKELFHADHAEESTHIHVAVLLPEGSDALDQVLKFMKRKANLHILPRVHMLAGSALDPADQKRAAVEEATALYVLPDIHRADATQEDLESIVRVLALRRMCPLTRIIVVLHRSIHRELLSGAGAETDAIAIDQLKLQLVGKSTAVPGFSTIVCNLCKTWSTQTKKKPTEAGAAAMASGAETDFEWGKEYEQGLGSELYEVPLSRFYWGTYYFPQVVRDILDKSVKKDVYLIGLVEVEKKPKGRWKKSFAPRGTGKDWQYQDGFMPAPNGRRKRVVLNPGSSYRIRNEPFCSTFGVFIAGDRDAILQPDALVHNIAEEDDEDSDKADDEQQGLTAFNKPKGPKKKVTEEERMQRRAAEQAKEAAAASQEALMAKDPNYKPRPKKEMLRNKPLRTALKPWEASEPKIVLMNDVYNEGKLPSQYDVDLLAEGGHVLFITFVQNCEALGLEYFVGPIRATYMASDGNPGPPIFVLGPSKPADWYAITQFDQCYFVQGNPFLLFDLERVNFQNASAIFVSSPPRSEGGEASMSDADAIFIVRMIESELQHIKLQSGGEREIPQVIAEITTDANHHFLPLPSKATGEHEEEDSDDDFDLLDASNGDRMMATPSQIIAQTEQATVLATKQKELAQQVTNLTTKLADVMAGEDSDEDFLSPKTRKTRKTMKADESANMEQAHKMQRLSTKAASLQAQLTVAIGQLQHATSATMSNLETTAKQKLGDGSRAPSREEKANMFSTAFSLGNQARAERARKKQAAKDAAVPTHLDGDYLIQPRYACGRLFASSIVTSLAVNTYYNPSLAKLIEEMINSRIVMIDVGKGWNEESYYDLFQFVLEQRDLLPIGIFRRAALPANMKSEAADQKKRKDRLRMQAQARLAGKRVSGGARQEPPDYYVYAAPTSRATYVTEMDQIICIMRKDWTGIPARYAPAPMNALMGPGMAMLGNQTMQQGLQHQGTATSLAMSQGGQTPGMGGRQTGMNMDMVGMNMTPQALAFGDPQSPHMQLPAGSPNWQNRTSPGAWRELQGGPAVGGLDPYPSPHQGTWNQAYSPTNNRNQTQGQAALPAPGNLPPATI